MPTYRMQFDVSDKAFQEFEELSKDLHLTRQELFRAAVRYLQWTWEHARNGEQIYVGRDQNLDKVKLPFFPI
jgi:hypothetical protein